MTVAIAGIQDNASFGQIQPPLISLDQVDVRFDTRDGEIEAIHAITLDIFLGELMVIVGPSGCGKTTLLRILAGLQDPSDGLLTYPSTQEAPSNALVFQGRSVFPWMTVADNILYGLDASGVKRDIKRQLLAELVTMTGLSGFERAYPHQLSEGMRQRVSIARALAVDPDLLLMDEPFGALDEQTRFILQEELLRIWEQTRKTVVLVTHSIDEALTLADRVVVMTSRPGQIKEVITVDLPRPRSIGAVRSNPKSARLFTRIWDQLRDEVAIARLQFESLS